MTAAFVTPQDHALAVETIEFNEANHSYKLNKKRLPGVTTILGTLGKPALVPWAAKMASEYFHDALLSRMSFADGTLEATIPADPHWLDTVRDEAKTAHTRKAKDGAYKGSIVHDALTTYHTDYFEFELPDHDLHPEAARAMGAFMAWLKQTTERGFQVVESERIILDRMKRYVGTTDLVLQSPDGFTVVADVKTNNASRDSTGVYPEHLLQAAAYAKAYGDEKAIVADATLIIHCDKVSGEFHEVWRSQTEWLRDYRAFEGVLAAHEHLKELRKAVKPEKAKDLSI